jgi:hypothetical protein
VTKENPEMNSAELEAESIIKEEFAKVDMDGEDCPLGEDCAIHFRNDEELIDDEYEAGRIITYAGDYAVTTQDNVEITAVDYLRTLLTGAELPPRYETCVIYVGSGPLFNVRLLSDEGLADAVRFIQLHDSWDNFKEAHASVLAAIKSGTIDLSKSAYPKK